MSRSNIDPRRTAGIITEVLNQIGLVWRLTFDRRVSLASKLILPFAILYIVSPIDLVPDFFAGVGQLDDLAILLIALRIFIGLAPKDVVQEHLDRRQGFGASGGKASTGPSSVIDGQYRVVDDHAPRE